MLLITPQEIIDTAFVPTENLDASLVRPTKIDIAQEYFLRPKLGSATFESLVEGANPDFVDQYIKAPLAYFVRYGILEELSVNVDRNGVALRLGGITTTTTTRNDNRNDKGNVTTTATQTKSSEQSKTDTTTGETTEIDATNKVVSVTTDSDQSNLTNTIVNPASEGLTETIDLRRSVDTDEVVDANIQKNTNNTVETVNKQTDTINSTNTENYDKNSVDESRNQQMQDNSRYQPATAAQIHTLQVRAMADANVLMNKALRYMERNADQFPLYAPQPRFYF